MDLTLQIERDTMLATIREFVLGEDSNEIQQLIIARRPLERHATKESG